MNKAMDLYLNNINNNYDAMGKIAMDNMAEVTINHSSGRKTTNRAERRRATKKALKRRNSKRAYVDYKPQSDWKALDDGGFKYYEKGDKAWSRKLRHQRFSEPLAEEPQKLTMDDFYGCELTSMFDSIGWDEEVMYDMGFNSFDGKFTGFHFRNLDLYHQYPVLFNRIFHYLEDLESIEALKEKREKLLEELNSLDDQIAHISRCLDF